MTDSTLFTQLSSLSTEQVNPNSVDIDILPIEEVLGIINTEDHLVPIAVRREIPYIAKAVELILEAFHQGGRLIYVGAGTSGRLGVVDASECPPTFGVAPTLVQAIIAGGKEAMFESVEGAEDSEQIGSDTLQSLGISNRDIVCGIAASKRTPFVIGAVSYAKEIGAKTLFITCNPRQEFTLDVDVAICPVVGPEVIMGSTRMKSGTAQKLVLNMITTTAMVKTGKTYKNMMVDLQQTNKKLIERSKRIIMLATGVSYEDATSYLAQSDYHVKTAIVMILASVSASEAKQRITEANGFVRLAIQ